MGKATGTNSWPKIQIIAKQSGPFYDQHDNGPTTTRPRFFATLLEDPFRRNRQMALLSGPRQVGKTATCQTAGDAYLTWDNLDDRRMLLKGPGALAERLDKAVEGWTDLGLGRFELRYLRDKQKREVDFLVVKEQKPWFLVEVKASDTHLSPALAHFQGQTAAPHAFQAVINLPFEPVDCFKASRPVVVPALTLLSQLL